MTETLIKNPYFGLEEKSDPEIPVATQDIYKYIEENYIEKGTDINRCSAATMCVKRRQFQRMGVSGTPITPRKIINFMMGDIAELCLLYFVKQACVGPGKLYSEVEFGEVQDVLTVGRKKIEIYKQRELSFELPDGTKIFGHADGFGKRNSDGRWEVVECKSSANWGFASFKEDGAKDYIKQAHALMMTKEATELKATSVRFFYLRKETGHIWDRVEKFNYEIASQVTNDYMTANKDEMISPPYQLVDEMGGRAPNKRPTGRKIAVFPCTYCPYIHHCFGRPEIEFKNEQFGGQSPVFVFKK